MFQPRGARAVACAGTLAFTLLLGSVAAVGVGGAFSGPGVHSLTQVSAELAPPIKRAVAWVGYLNDTTAPRFRINSVSVGAPHPDEFQIAYANGSFSLDYESLAGGPVTASYGITLKSLLEWNDLNSNGRIDDGTAVNVTPLGSVAFGARPISHTQWTTANGTVVHSFVIASNNIVLGNTVEMSVTLTISEGLVTLSSNQVLTPMEAKLTIQFVQNLALPTDRVALKLGVNTGNRLELENESWDETNQFHSDERALNVTNVSGVTSSSAFFSWSNEASVNGQFAAVTSYLVANLTQGGQDLYLAYPNPPPASLGSRVIIKHDPSMGVVSSAYESVTQIPSTPTLAGDLLLYLATAAAVAGLVVATAYRMRRRTR
jgi:hypothetical protein